MTRMDAELPWFKELSAEDRSWVGLIVQAGVRAFVDWFREGAGSLCGRGSGAGRRRCSAPRPARWPASSRLQQTVDLVKLSIEVVESNIDALLDPADVPEVRTAVARYAREVAFATAEVYARAAEARGAWDARLEALVVDAVLRAEADETVLSRASALGWAGRGGGGRGARPGARRAVAAPTCSTRCAGWRRPPDWTRCARSRASDWW